QTYSFIGGRSLSGSFRRVELAGKTVLLSGATGGLGRAIAVALASRGATLVLSSRKQQALDELAGSLPGDGHRVVVADLAEPHAPERLASEAGSVDVLVANAGLPGTGKLGDFSSEELGRVLRVNLEAPIRLTHELLPAMQERGSGHLVFVSSLSGKAVSPRASLYSATKFGLRGFSLALREDLWKHGVGVSLVSPGFVREAGMFHDSGATPPPGFGTTSPDEVGEAVATAIERNRHEVEVAPALTRVLANFALRRPELAARIAYRRGRGTKIAERVASGQADKR
ncbi:MAG TPA: SDR family NAD(P)-dependent oxidoreductase, partial [Solirubrobacterales bacterium]|nr:SDR family NAD(P)-dependent oxidoreductase [Solirubrobacterales bacterium]